MRSNFNSPNKYGYISNADELPHQQIGMYDSSEKYIIAYIPVNHLEQIPEEEYRAAQPHQQVYYLDGYKTTNEDMIYQKNYSVVSDVFGKMIDLTGGTVKTLARSTADNLVIPVGSYVAKNIVAPVGEHVAKEIVFPVGKYVSQEITVPVGKYVAKEIAVPVGKYVAKEVALPIAKEVVAESQDIIKELTEKSMKLMEDFIKARVEQLKEDIKQEIKEMPGKIIGGIEDTIKIPLEQLQEIKEMPDKIVGGIKATLGQLKGDIKQEIKGIPGEIAKVIKGKVKIPFLGADTFDEADYDAYVKDHDEFAW